MRGTTKAVDDLNRDSYHRTLTPAELKEVGVSSWKRAAGIRWHKGETNPGLAQRDYSVKCATTGVPIILIEGFWIWWCIPHHEPLPWCDRERARLKVRGVRKALGASESWES